MASVFTSVPFRILRAEKAFIMKHHKHAGSRIQYERHRVRPIPTMYSPHETVTSCYQNICSRYSGLASILDTEKAFILGYKRDKNLRDNYFKSRMQ